MRKLTWSTGACLLGVLTAVTMIGGMRAPTHAAEVATSSARALDVVVNEISWSGTGASSADEWIELHNTTEQPITLTGWVLEASSSGPDIALEGTIPSRGYFLLERTDDDTITDTEASQTYGSDGWSWALGNSGEALTLTDKVGSVIDTANANGGAWPGGTGYSGSPEYASMERIDPTAPDTDDNWGTNDGVTRNGQDAGGDLINGTPKARNSCYSVPGLTLAKRGPSIATGGVTLSCRILVSNTGHSPSADVVVTDVLPAELEFITQTSHFTFEEAAPDTLRWDLGGLPSGTLRRITLTLRPNHALSGTVTNVVTAAERSGRVESASWIASAVPYVRLYALAPANYGGSGEAAAIINLSPYTASVEGWWLNDESEPRGVLLGSGTTIGPGRVFWLAQDNDGFREIWGFEPDQASWDYWPGFTDHGEAAYLMDADGRVIDALAYGDGEASRGWYEDAVPYPYPGHGGGQVLYRKLVQTTGLPVPDTDTAADWAQDPDDPIDGRKLRYPGWDLEAFFTPVVAASTAPITLAAAPDGAFEMVSHTLGAAQGSILLEGYTFESGALHDVLADRLQAGVAITMFLEGTPAGWPSEDRGNELWIAEQIHEHPNGAVYFMYGDAPRYRYQHAKFAVVDGQTALVSTENFNPSAMPSDRKDNGTKGHRGFVAAVEDSGIVTHLQSVFAHDLDLAHHADLVPYGTHPLELDEPGFVPLPEPDWTAYTAPFTASLTTTGLDIAVVQAPENTLHDRDALLGLLGRAGSGDHIAAFQLDEPYTWTVDAGEVGLNPRLQALVRAAWRGADVRLLLDSYFDDGDNETTCRILNRLASEEDLALTCRLGNPTGLGIHAKTFLAHIDGERWVHLGSINGTEVANKGNREIALQFRSQEAYGWMFSVFEHDWARARGPYVAHLYLPVVMRGYIGPVDYPLITEVLINPDGADAGGEWIEIHNPGPTVSVGGWALGDALALGDYGDGRYAFPTGAELLSRQVIVVAQCAQRFADARGRNPEYELGICSEGYTDDPTVTDLEPVDAWEGFGLALGNKQDEVLLTEGSGSIVDSVAWGGEDRAGVKPYPLDPGDTFPWGKISLKRYPADTDSDDCSRDFYISYNPSPGYVASD